MYLTVKLARLVSDENNVTEFLTYTAGAKCGFRCEKEYVVNNNNLDRVTRIFTETNLPCCWMWNMRSPPFRYSITKNRCDWNRKLGLLKNIIPHTKAGVTIG